MRYYDKKFINKPEGFTSGVRDRLHHNIFDDLAVSSICEVGIGAGHLARYCRENKIDWVGIEPNEKSRDNLINQGFAVYNGTMPIFPDISEQFDTIVASHVIEHLNNVNEALDFLRISREKLDKKGGRFIVLMYPDIEKWGSYFWVDYSHSFITTKKRIEDMLIDTNWNIIRSERYLGCYFRFSNIMHEIGKLLPLFLLPEELALSLKSSLQLNVMTIAEIA
jgi:SAM-dependent methyltransferase